MAEVRFNKTYRDKELKREIKAHEPVEMTIKRADEVVKNIRSQSDKFEGYENFDYERIEKKENQESQENQGKGV